MRTRHLHLRRALLKEVAGGLVVGDPAHIEILSRFGDSDPLIEHLMLGVRDALEQCVGIRTDAGLELKTVKALDDGL